MPTVYLVVPESTQHPHITVWVKDVRALLAKDPVWGWGIVELPCDKQAQIELNPLRARIHLLPGPVAVIEPISRKTWDGITRILPTVIAIRKKAAAPEDIWELLEEARRRYEDREPMLPLRRVAAVKIIRDLNENDAWAGISKGYRWWSLTRNDIGPKFTPVAEDVISILRQHGLVDSKKKKQGAKYCLLKERAHEIRAIVMDARFNGDLQAALDRNQKILVPAAFLLEPKQATAWKVGIKGQPLATFDSPQKAIDAIKQLPDGERYLWEVHFGGANRSLREEETDKSIVIETFEVYCRVNE